MPKSKGMKAAVPLKEKEGRGRKTSYSNVLAILEWLEEPRNFRLITGAAAKDHKGVVAGAKLKKIDG